MSRFGLGIADMQERSVFEGLNLQLVISHLACADVPDSPANAMQRKRFVKMGACFPGFRAPGPLRPVVSLDARIVQIRTVQAGDGGGYGLNWTAFRSILLTPLPI